jgi:hypothetical protein
MLPNSRFYEEYILQVYFELARCMFKENGILHVSGNPKKRQGRRVAPEGEKRSSCALSVTGLPEQGHNNLKH